MIKITKAQLKTFVKGKLSTDPKWAQGALLKIFEFQTMEEQKSKDSIYRNGVGFTGADGRILTSFATFLQRNRYLSEKQMTILMKKMPKYWEQIIKISDKDKLYSLIQY